MSLKGFLLSYSIAFLSVFIFSTAQANNYCKVGRYFHHAESSVCRGQPNSYCFSRQRGYYICENNQETTATTQTSSTQGEYCKVGRYWHAASSPVCRERPIDQCRINGLFGDCDRSASTPSPSTTTVATQGYRSMTCSRPETPFQCMMCNCYHEARGESEGGRLAVGKVVMTRARMSAYPNTVCGVVYQNSHRPYPQFSWTNQPSRNRVMSRSGYERCEAPSREALAFNGHFASHYHTHAVRPRWRHNCRGSFSIGSHIFYRDCGVQTQANTSVQVRT